MAPSGGSAPSGHSERRMVGLFSLALGALLFLLIVARGQQAAREGNSELQNDTYWVLVSPLVFSGFGLYLLRTPGKTRRRGAGAPPHLQPPPPPPPPPPALQQSLVAARREAEQSRQALTRAQADAEQRLAQARLELSQTQLQAADQAERMQQAADQAQTRITSLEQQLTALLHPQVISGWTRPARA